MNAITCLISRRSIREFDRTKPVVDQDIENIVDIAQMASSWENTQPIRYLAIMNHDVQNRIATEATPGAPWNEKNIKDAPALVVLLVKKGLSGYNPDGTLATGKGLHWQSFDCGAAAAHFCLAAAALHIGTLVMGRYDEKKIMEILQIPDDYETGALIAVGYPSLIPAANERKQEKEVLKFIR